MFIDWVSYVKASVLTNYLLGYITMMTANEEVQDSRVPVMIVVVSLGWRLLFETCAAIG